MRRPRTQDLDKLLRTGKPGDLVVTQVRSTEATTRCSTSYTVVLLLLLRLVRERSQLYLGADDVEALAETAFQVAGEVDPLLTSGGYPMKLGVVPPGALIRSLYLPSYTADDLAGISRTTDGFPAFEPGRNGMSLLAHDPANDVTWHHAVGNIPHDGWPTDIVAGRLLEGFVLQAPPGLRRTVASQFRFLPQEEARGHH